VVEPTDACPDALPRIPPAHRGGVGRPVLPESAAWRRASLWWPADRAWLVATDIDGYSTYVGASHAAVEAVLADPDLDAVAVDPWTPLDSRYG